MELQQPGRQLENRLLGADEPAPFQILNPDSKKPIQLVCDHASNRIPASLNNLGIFSPEITSHIGYDIGTKELGTALAARVGCRTVMCNYSRLVIDCNRLLDDPSLMPDVSDKRPIPGNRNLDSAQRDARIEHIYTPYHNAIGRSLDELQVFWPQPALISLHSFTPQLRGADERPWHVGVLWDKDSRLSSRFLKLLREQPDLCVGDNQPYSGKHPADYTIDNHGEARHIPCVSFEIRQDLLSSEAGISEWVERLALLLESIESEHALFS